MFPLVAKEDNSFHDFVIIFARWIWFPLTGHHHEICQTWSMIVVIYSFYSFVPFVNSGGDAKTFWALTHERNLPMILRLGRKNNLRWRGLQHDGEGAMYDCMNLKCLDDFLRTCQTYWWLAWITLIRALLVVSLSFITWKNQIVNSIPLSLPILGSFFNIHF